MNKYEFDHSGATQRHRKIASIVHRELSSILQTGVKDPRISNITITQVSVPKDLKSANVYVYSSESEEHLRQGVQALNRAAGFIRTQICRNLNMKYTPTIKFFPDLVPETGARISALLDKVSNSG